MAKVDCYMDIIGINRWSHYPFCLWGAARHFGDYRGALWNTVNWVTVIQLATLSVGSLHCAPGERVWPRVCHISVADESLKPEDLARRVPGPVHVLAVANAREQPKWIRVSLKVCGTA
jgi:hypothetical protein